MTLDTQNLFNLAEFQSELEKSGSQITVYKAAISKLTATLASSFEQGAAIEILVQQRAWFIDQIIINTWNGYFAHCNSELALVAVGGYGRGEMHPCSDVDLLIILQDNALPSTKEGVQSFVTFLWDIGLDVGHGVRTLDECQTQAKEDITIITNMMESRYLCGSHLIFTQLQEAISPENIWPAHQFFVEKHKEQIQRHKKFSHSAYSLEPNLKECQGGLRDIQMILWVTMRYFNLHHLSDLVAKGFLTKDEYEKLINGQHFLWRIRFLLHTLNKRKEDRLLFEYQTKIAVQLGYKDEECRLGVESFMRDYYLTISLLSRLNEMLLQLFHEEILLVNVKNSITPINKRFQVHNGYIESTHENVFKQHPFALLEVFLLLQMDRTISGVRAGTIRQIRDHRYLINDTFRNDLRCKSLFMEILKQPQGVTHELRRMNRYGILQAYLPSFEKITGLMQYDLFHIYTVEQHTLMVLRNIRRLTVPEFMNELPQCSQIIQQIPKLDILYLAALFHDIAKGRRGDHAKLGAIDALEFCLNHGLSQYDAEFVAWLVSNHLVMSTTAQKKDISDPAVLSEFAAIVGDSTHLDYLYLLTIADIRGTDPKLWNSWKQTLLSDLYQFTQSTLKENAEEINNEKEVISKRKSEAEKLLINSFPNIEAVHDLWKSFGGDYFLRHSADEICWHAQAIIAYPISKLPLIMIRPFTKKGGTELFIYSTDEPNLFSQIVNLLDNFGLNVVDARILTTKNGMTLDTFIVLDNNNVPVAENYRVQEITESIRSCLARKEPINPNTTRHRSRRHKSFTHHTDITFSSDYRQKYTILNVHTNDYPGLLALIGRVLENNNISVVDAKITSLGERVEDVFFISNPDKSPISSTQQCLQLEKELLHALDSGH